MSKTVKRLCAVIISILLTLLISCQKNDKKIPDYPEITQAIIDTVMVLSKHDSKLKVYYIDSLLKDFKQAGPGDRWTLHSIRSNMFIFNLKDTLEGKRAIDSMYANVVAYKDQYPQNYAWTLYNHATLLLISKNYTESFSKYYEGLTFAKQKLDSCDVGVFYDALASIKMKQLKYQDAIPYLKSSAKYQFTCKPNKENPGRMPLTQGTIKDIGFCYEKLGKLDSASFYYQQALNVVADLAKQYQMDDDMLKYYRGNYLGSLGAVMAVAGDQKLAEAHLLESISLMRDPKCGCSPSISADNALLGLYLNQGRLKDGEKLLAQIEIIIAENSQLRQNAEELINFYGLHIKYLEQAGQLTKIYPIAKRYNHLRDSVETAKKELYAMDLETRFKNEEQAAALALLAKDNQLKQLYLFGAITIGLMGAIILWLVIKNLQKSKEQVKQLKELNYFINHQNEQMSQALLGLEQSQKENTKFLKIVAHDLRNPIGAMTKLSEILMERNKDQEETEMLGMMKDAGEQALNLVNDLLETNSDKNNLNIGPADLKSMINYCVNISSLKAEVKQQRIVFEAEDISIPLDREKFWRVVSNLIGNAIKFSKVGQTIAVKLSQDINQVIISVVDEGIGIPPEMQNKIFDMKSDAQRVGTAGESTFGLGLAICKQIVEAHRGKIWFESEANKGTAFYVTLPKQ